MRRLFFLDYLNYDKAADHRKQRQAGLKEKEVAVICRCGILIS